MSRCLHFHRCMDGWFFIVNYNVLLDFFFFILIISNCIRVYFFYLLLLKKNIVFKVDGIFEDNEEDYTNFDEDKEQKSLGIDDNPLVWGLETSLSLTPVSIVTLLLSTETLLISPRGRVDLGLDNYQSRPRVVSPWSPLPPCKFVVAIAE